MLKKVMSIAASLIILTASVVNGGDCITSSAFDLGGFLEEQLAKSKTITPSRGNMLNFVVNDGSGNELDRCSVDILDASGQKIGFFYNGFFFKEEGCTSPINDKREWEVKMKTFGDLVSPQIPIMACDYDVCPEPGTLVSYGIYEKYDPNINVLLSCNIESTECTQMKILATNSDEKTAFTIPANKAGIFVDQKWASRDGEGYYYTGDTSKKYYAQKDMIGNLKKISPDSLDDFYIGLEDILSYDLRLDITPEYQKTETEYVKWTMNLSEIFKGTDYPSFNSDGTFSWDGKTFDFRQDKKYTSCMLTIVSGACVTVAMPDSSGNVDFYVEKDGRIFDAEINLCYKKSKNDSQKYVCFKETWLYGGTEYTINIGVPNIPRAGATVFNVPAGKYTLEFTNVPDGYINPGTVTLDVAETSALQKKSVTLKAASTLSLGDVDGSRTVDSADASRILEAYARESTGKTTLFSSKQQNAADVNDDDRIDSTDASYILAYYSYTSTGGNMALKDYVKS